MMVVTTNGRIVDVFGLYSANYSDSKILESLLNQKFFSLFHHGDIINFDRGLTDATAKLTVLGFVVKMPCCNQVYSISLPVWY